MRGYRQIDQLGLSRVAGLLGEASADLHAIAGVVGPHSSHLRLVAANLEWASADLRRRRVVFVALRLPPLRTDPRPFSMVGINQASERWEHGSRNVVEDRVRTSVVGGEWHGSAAARSRAFSGALGTLSAAALVVDGQAEGWIGIEDWGLELGGVVGAGAHLAQIEYGLEAEQVGLAGEVFVGVEAAATGELDLGPTNGDLGIDLGLDAFVGAGAAGSVAVGMSGATVVAGGEVGVGLGLDVDGAATYSDGRFNFDLGASAFLGLGGGFDFTLELDIAAVGSDLLGAVEATTDWIASLWN